MLQSLVLWLPTIFDLLLLLVGFYLIYDLSNDWLKNVKHMEHDELTYGKVIQSTLKQYNATKWLLILTLLAVATQIHSFQL